MCVCCVFVSLCKGVVVFLVIITGLVSYKGDVSGTGSAAIPTDVGCSKEPLRVMNVVGVMEAGGSRPRPRPLIQGLLWKY